MNKTLDKKLKGYQKAPRERFNLLCNGVLSHTEFLVYEFCIAITDWDENHETYGSFAATNLQIALTLGWKDDSTVSRIKKSLIQKGVFKKAFERIEVVGFEDWQLRGRPSANKQHVSVNNQEVSVLSQEPSANIQEKPPAAPTYPLVSFKGNVGFLRTDDEYHQIWIEQFDSSPSFTPDDMKWIDQNVYETENRSTSKL